MALEASNLLPTSRCHPVRHHSRPTNTDNPSERLKIVIFGSILDHHECDSALTNQPTFRGSECAGFGTNQPTFAGECGTRVANLVISGNPVRSP